MDSIEEKRVYGTRDGATRLYVTSSIGVVRVRVAGDAVGEFSLCARCNARDIATVADGRVVIATDEDIREETATNRDTDAANRDDLALENTGFGPAVAVGATDSTLLAAGPDGDLGYRTLRNRNDGTDWHRCSADAITSVRAIDRDLVATDDGVYRFRPADGELEHAGLSDARDVSAAGIPLAATADGLYKLGNGWMEIREELFETVTADPRTERGRLARAHAISSAGDSNDTVYAFTDDDWTAIETPDEPIVDIGYGTGPTAEREQSDGATETSSDSGSESAGPLYAVTERGTILVTTEGADEENSWRRRSLGVTDVTGLAVPASTVESDT
ncbi:HVO_0234 family beta-propeller protein [Natrialba aegyptia]|uniref:HVO_0234 family beta-propeller protein n=1 Tax=Natrialba aegyptia TaxID=129789 RepID=UPI00403AC531